MIKVNYVIKQLCVTLARRRKSNLCLFPDIRAFLATGLSPVKALYGARQGRPPFLALQHRGTVQCFMSDCSEHGFAVSTQKLTLNFTPLASLTSLNVCQTGKAHNVLQIYTNMTRNSRQSFNKPSFIAGLNEAEAFDDIELMAEFSLSSVVQNLQQGKWQQACWKHLI